MNTETMIVLIAFLMASSGVLLVYTFVSGRKTHLDERLEGLADPQELGISGSTLSRQAARAPLAQTALPRIGTALVPTDEEERTVLGTRLIHAGFYGREAMPMFLGVKLLLMVGPALVGLALAAMGLAPMYYAVLAGGCLGILGMIGPSFWLDSRKAQRQIAFRRALPDALDLLVICLEGGLSLAGSLRRIAGELSTAHPIVATELNIVQREIQLGRTPGDSLQQMGVRTDLEEIQSLASVITQAERFGASLVKSLRVHAETLRVKRQQYAEEMAQKASIKVLFPTLLFIFPAIFVVILGPAAYQIYEVMGNMK
jgi:tight adherence protein C